MLNHPENPTPYEWNAYYLNLLFIFVFVLLLIPIFRKLPFTYGLISLAFVMMPLLTGKTDSIARYYLMVFPVYMVLAYWSHRGNEEQQSRRLVMIGTGFAMLLALGMMLYTLGVTMIA